MDLMKNKRVMLKLVKYNNYVRQTGTVGTRPRTLFINPNNICNFNCEQCYTSSPNLADNSTIDIEKLSSLADEADELGIYEIVIEGGEPLIYQNLFEILNVFGSDRFYLAITTNGYLLDEDMAKRLSEAGVARVVVSLDSLEADVHDSYRGKKGAFERAVQALENAKNAGMQASVNFLVGHHNVQTGEVEKACEFCAEHNYQLGLISAAPVGNWKGNWDIMLDENDSKRLNKIRHRYKNVWRDLWPAVEYGNQNMCSCPTVNRSYINPNGDVLPCPYLHIKIGNIYESSLKEIFDYGFSIKYFCDNSKSCFSAEDKDFAQKYLGKDMSVMKPLPADEVFEPEDFVDKNACKNESYAALLKRRSIRRFEKTPVEMAVLNELVRAGMYAPSPLSRQPWEFVVVTDREKLTEMSVATPFWRILKRVPAAIVVLLVNTESSNPEAPLFYVHACSCASENILIAAEGNGLGAVWLGLHPLEDRMQLVRKVLDIPEDVLPFSVIPIGYPAETIAPKAFFDDSKVHYDTYSATKDE